MEESFEGFYRRLLRACKTKHEKSILEDFQEELENAFEDQEAADVGIVSRSSRRVEL